MIKQLKKQVQHKATRDERKKTQDIRDLKKEINTLRKDLARFRKLATKPEVVKYEHQEPPDVPVETCPHCASPFIKKMSTPMGTEIKICAACKKRLGCPCQTGCKSSTCDKI